MSKLYDYYGIEIKKNESLFNEGDPADYMYMIHEGSVKISRTIKNHEEILQTLNEGEFVGEMAVIDSTTRSANAIALVDSKLIKMDVQSFDELMVSNNQFAITFTRFLSKRIRSANDIIKDQATTIRNQKFHIEVLYEFLKKGKRDQSDKWILFDRDDLINILKNKHQGNEDYFWTYLDDFLMQGTLTLKKDNNNKDWLALDLSLISQQ